MPDPLTHYYPPRTEERDPTYAPPGFTRAPSGVTCSVCLAHLAAAPHVPEAAGDA